ncbi:EamA family transporter [Thalassobaculum sp. OXR-137]|uniref:DMT family transporter n=1 Tax=Thalassobaculum sp. OXR-137 TaxID=3100173 RepID=UPI002AC9DAC3|nr:EamA family transporter [Thalassobaculum sp. OXR-137]WPZ34703.1 EamA family transporter [Thalassobaculum sp. OXR-137]
MPPRAAPPLFEFALLGCLALLWGGSYPLLKVAVAEIPPITLIAVRVSVAAVLLLGIALIQGERLPTGRTIWARLFLQAFLNSYGAWTLLAWGQRQIESALGAVLNSTSPLFVFLFTVLVTRHESMGGVRLLGACLGLGGVVLIVGTDALNGLGGQVAAQIAVLVSAALYAGAALHGRRFSHLPPVVTAAGTMLCATAVLLPASLMADRPWELTPSPKAVAAALVLGVACTGIALLLYFRLVRTLGSLGVASQSYLRAGVGVLLGVLVLGETLTPTVVAGVVAAIAGVLAINWRR